MHVLSVSSLKGGVGKTTVSLGLASAAYAAGLRTLVVDLDTQCDASTGLGVVGDSHGTVVDVLKNPRHHVVLESIVSSSWSAGRSGKIDVMVGDPTSSKFDAPDATTREVWKLEEALFRVENDYDLVIIDTPPSLNGLTRTAWTASDRVLIVAEPGIFAVSAVERSIRAVEELHASLNNRLAVVGVVLNRLQSEFAEHDYRKSELAENVRDLLLPVEIRDRASVQQAQGAARPIHSWPGESAAEISANFDELLKLIQASFATVVGRRTRNRLNRSRRGQEPKRRLFRRGKSAD